MRKEENCHHCRQILSEASLFAAVPGKSENAVLTDPASNIEMDEEDDGALQYTIYCLR